MTADPTPDSALGSSGGEPLAAKYDEYYFEHCLGKPYKRDTHWVSFFAAIADHLIATIQPRTVLDAGCALGILVEALRARGVEAEGIDVSEFAVAHVYEPIRPYCRVGSIADEFPGRYDLIISIEVLEHMPARDGEAAIANFCRHTDDVVFSSTPLDHRETTHVNVQPPEYWAELFARHGFYRDVDFDASFITPWAARFRRSEDPVPRIIRGYERRCASLWMERNQLRTFASELQQQVAQSLDKIPAVQHELDHVRGQLDAERVSNAEVRATLLHAASELQAARAALQSELAHVRAALEETYAQAAQLGIRDREVLGLTHDLQFARETIRNMERSIFWRMRKWLGR